MNHPDPSVQVADTSPPAHRDYDGGFVTKLAHKDLVLAVKAAESTRVPLSLGRTCEEIFRPLATDQDWANRDFSGVLQALGNIRNKRQCRSSL